MRFVTRSLGCVLRAVAADLFFNCWYLEIPSDYSIRHEPRCKWKLSSFEFVSESFSRMSLHSSDFLKFPPIWVFRKHFLLDLRSTEKALPFLYFNYEYLSHSRRPYAFCILQFNKKFQVNVAFKDQRLPDCNNVLATERVGPLPPHVIYQEWEKP
jgi:hypothetical protein